MTQTWKKVAAVSVSAVMLAGALASCDGSAVSSIDHENPVLTVQTKAFNADSAANDSPVVQVLGRYAPVLMGTEHKLR